MIGEGLPEVARLALVEGRNGELPPAAVWVLRGVTSHDRYVTRREHDLLAAHQPSLGREEATHAALIPVRKSPAWWSLPQDERRAIFEDRSHHITVALEYLPAVARRLHHSRELGEAFRQTGITVDDFEGFRFRRIGQIKKLLEEGRLDDRLRWRETRTRQKTDPDS